MACVGLMGYNTRSAKEISPSRMFASNRVGTINRPPDLRDMVVTMIIMIRMVIIMIIMVIIMTIIMIIMVIIMIRMVITMVVKNDHRESTGAKSESHKTKKEGRAVQYSIVQCSTVQHSKM
jgi:hypothetical protein